jgi:hypothetical protein
MITRSIVYGVAVLLARIEAKREIARKRLRMTSAETNRAYVDLSVAFNLGENPSGDDLEPRFHQGRDRWENCGPPEDIGNGGRSVRTIWSGEEEGKERMMLKVPGY